MLAKSRHFRGATISRAPNAVYLNRRKCVNSLQAVLDSFGQPNIAYIRGKVDWFALIHCAFN